VVSPLAFSDNTISSTPDPSGPVKDSRCSFAARTNSAAAFASADGSGRFLRPVWSVSGSSRHPPREAQRLAGQAGNTFRSTDPIPMTVGLA